MHFIHFLVTGVDLFFSSSAKFDSDYSFCGYQELDFLVEAQNSQKCLHNFCKLSPHIAENIHVPLVYWNLSTSKLLTMEFMDGVQVNDVKGIQKMGIQPSDVSRLVTF